jgi:1-pyrroline-5-carboxylate dehydrogenase
MVHENWVKNTDILDKLASLANRRNLEDLTVGPTLSVTTQKFKQHIDRLLQIPGARVLWGGSEINNGEHSIPECYGAMRPTAVYVPLDGMLAGEENFRAATREIFAPFQVVTEYRDADIPKARSLLRTNIHVCMCVPVHRYAPAYMYVRAKTCACGWEKH